MDLLVIGTPVGTSEGNSPCSNLDTDMGGELRSSSSFRCSFCRSPSPVITCDMLHRQVELSNVELIKLIHDIQGKGKTPREVLKRIDYGGTVTTLTWVCKPLGFLSGHRLDCHRFFPPYYF